MSSCHSRIYGAEFSKEDMEQAVKNGTLLSMEIEFNSSCNFNCVYCYATNNLDPKEELTKEEIRDLILQARDLGARKIIILGGEPMLYPHIIEMVRFIRGQGFEIEMFTNGVNMTPSAAQVLFENRVVVVLKMNSFDEKIQDMLAGKKGAYKQIQETFNNLKHAGYPSGDCHMGISSIVCKQNIDELTRMWEWLRDQGIDPYFEVLTPQGKAKENDFLRVESSRLRDFFYKIADIERKKYGYNWEPQPPLVGGQCLRHQFSCSVNSRGYVQSCVGVTIPVGSIREKKLKDIIRDSEVISDLRNYQQTLKGPCGECSRLSECYGCRGAAYQFTGDYLASDPLCWKNSDRRGDIAVLPVEISGLVPHKPPMLTVDRLLTVGERSSVSEMEISKDAVFVGENGKLDDAFFPEIISQAIAAQDGFKHFGNGKSRPDGMLLGIKNLEISGSAYAGDRLRVSVHKVAKYGEFGVIQGEVFKGNDLIAKGEVKIWQGEK